jgi:hypothetical protein
MTTLARGTVGGITHVFHRGKRLPVPEGVRVCILRKFCE